ncbi:B3/4 domain-containing protein [Denitrobacterium detoxificans]|jgi:DNA/RNA-binding domain of Phe-tRNA-synthetase-like protein|uniref:B3/B4 domain-containing protein n=1 Tax=Denitrobacterium detoxificans TaxID=79604 RepID=UPI0026EB54DC|nr:phenylalanine--tRNA ligase beta subunit-related protein [Denitrobacterium detoxificans]MBE6465269.1 hypothetical protein [Denitrobacterium detoxificans]
MQKFIADESLWELFPDAAIAVLSFKGVQETKELSEQEAIEVRQLLAAANEEANKYLTSNTISQNAVPAAWRAAYQKFPTKKGARCSIENLLKRVLKGNPVGTIAPSVDITNAISLKYAFPIGVENLGAVEGDLRLGAMQGGEDFLPIGSDKQEPPLPGEIAYYDTVGAICRCWNWRDGQRTEVNDATTEEFVAMECIEPERIDDLRAAMDELAELMTKYLNAEVVAKEIITKDNPEAVIA